MITELINTCKPYIAPLAVSCAVHIGIANYAGFSSVADSKIQLKSGKSVMELTLLPSISSKAAAASKKSESSPCEPINKKNNETKKIKEKILSKSVGNILKQPMPSMSSGVKRIETKTLCSDKIIAAKTDKKLPEPEHRKQNLKKQIQNNTETEQLKTDKISDNHKKTPDEPSKINQQINSINSPLIEADMRKKGVSCECSALSELVVKYPRVSRRKSEQGTVDLNIKIDEYGNVVKIEITSSSGYKRLDRSAVKSLKKAKFMPAKKNGKNTASEIKMNIIFKLDDCNE